MRETRETSSWLRRGALIGLVLLVLVGGVLIARNRLLPAEEAWRITIDRAQSVLDSNAQQILLWSGSGDLIVLDRSSGNVAFRIPLGAPVQNAALLESGVMAQWQDPDADEATLGVATGPDDWLWQQQVPVESSRVIGVDAATDRMVLERNGKDPVLQGLDAGTGDVVWSKGAEFHSGWLGPMDPRHSFFGQTQLGTQESDGDWSLLSTEDGSVSADLGAIEPLTWQGHVVGNAAADGCEPAVLLDGAWQPVDWQDEGSPPECQWLQPSSGIGWLTYELAGETHLRPVDLDTAQAGADRTRGKSPPSDDFPPTVFSVHDLGTDIGLIDVNGRKVWRHDGFAKLYPGPASAAAVRDTDALSQLAAGSTDIRRLELLSATGESLARATQPASDTSDVHLLSGQGVVFVMDDEVILLGQ